MSWRLRELSPFVIRGRMRLKPQPSAAGAPLKQDSGLELRVFGGPLFLDPAGWAYVRRAQ